MSIAQEREVIASVVELPAKTRVLLVDDHDLIREGLRHLLEATGEVEIVGEAVNGQEAISYVQDLRPDVVLMDINMPEVDGIRATEVVSRCCPETNVIVLTMSREDEYAIDAVRAGASGYLLKSARSAEVVRAVKLAARGGSAIDPSLAPVLMREYHRMVNQEAAEQDGTGTLSERDRALLRLLAAGNNNRQIAAELKLAESTVKNNLSALFAKIDVRDRTQAVLYAFDHGIVTK